MEDPATIHLRLRRLLRRFPFRNGADVFNSVVGKLWFDRADPVWLRSEPYRDHPAMELNVSEPSQRKIFYFPSAYGEAWWRGPFGELASSILQPGDVVIDLGAGVGYPALLCARLVGERGRVYPFEADLSAYESLRRTLALNGIENVRPQNLALSDRDGELPTRVRITRLDHWMRTSGVDRRRIRLIRLDAGADAGRAVTGMAETLERAGLPDVWCVDHGRAPAQATRELAGLGYEGHAWRGGAPVPLLGRGGDVLFRRRP